MCLLPGPEPLHLSILKTKSIHLEHRYRTYVRRVRIRKSRTWSALGWIRPSFLPSIYPILPQHNPAQLIPKNRSIAIFAGTWYRGSAAGFLSFFLSFFLSSFLTFFLSSFLSFLPSHLSIHPSIHPPASTYAVQYLSLIKQDYTFSSLSISVLPSVPPSPLLPSQNQKKKKKEKEKEKKKKK